MTCINITVDMLLVDSTVARQRGRGELSCRIEADDLTLERRRKTRGQSVSRDRVHRLAFSECYGRLCRGLAEVLAAREALLGNMAGVVGHATDCLTVGYTWCPPIGRGCA